MSNSVEHVASAVAKLQKIAARDSFFVPQLLPEQAAALLLERETIRLAALDLLRRLDKMGGTVTEGHSRRCGVWRGQQCGCAIARHIAALQEAVGYGA